MISALVAYVLVAVGLLWLLRQHPQELEEDLGADLVVALAWAPILAFVCIVLAWDHRSDAQRGAA